MAFHIDRRVKFRGLNFHPGSSRGQSWRPPLSEIAGISGSIYAQWCLASFYPIPLMVLRQPARSNHIPEGYVHVISVGMVTG
jgi:hypothetical protein